MIRMTRIGTTITTMRSPVPNATAFLIAPSIEPSTASTTSILAVLAVVTSTDVDWTGSPRLFMLCCVVQGAVGWGGVYCCVQVVSAVRWGWS